MLYFFYIYSFLSFSPFFILQLLKNPIKNKFINLFLIILGSFKSLFDIVVYYTFFTELGITGKTITIMMFFINIIFYFKVSNNSNQPLNKEKKVKIINERISKINLKSNTSKKSYKSIIQEANDYFNTGEIFSFYYKGASDVEYNLRNIVINDIYNTHSYTYIEGIDIDIDSQRTFRTDRIISTTQKLDILSEVEFEELKVFYEKSKQTKQLIEKINFTNPVKFFDISEDIDITSVLSNNGFIKKNGKNCQVFDASFKYLGSKLWSITSLKKRHPYILSPVRSIFIENQNYAFFEDIYTYSPSLIEQLNNYDEKKVQEAEVLLKLRDKIKTNS